MAKIFLKPVANGKFENDFLIINKSSEGKIVKELFSDKKEEKEKIKNGERKWLQNQLNLEN
jgi:hypothetical protein